MKKPLIVLALLPAALGATACGGDDKSDEEQVRDVIELVNKKDDKACDQLTDKYMKDVIGGDKDDCKEQVENTPTDAVKIRKVTVNGDKATVNARVERTNGQIFLVKEDGDWKLDDVRRSR